MAPKITYRRAAFNSAGHVIGEGHRTAKLTDADIELIHELRAEGLSYRQISAKFDDGLRVSHTHVAFVCQGKRRSQSTAGWRSLPPRPWDCGPADPDEFDDWA